MKTLTLFGALLFGLVVVQAEADARALRKNETYCLETSAGGGGRGGGGGTHFLCRFETMAQCEASKVDHGDSCGLNPEIAFERRGRR